MPNTLNIALHPTIHMHQARKLADSLGLRLVTRGWKVVLAPAEVRTERVWAGRVVEVGHVDS